MYKSYRVTYSVGTRQGSTFKPGSNTYLLETVVQAISPTQAQSIVEAQNGGSQHCSVNRVLPL